jgi:hypothetical protein
LSGRLAPLVTAATHFRWIAAFADGARHCASCHVVRYERTML